MDDPLQSKATIKVGDKNVTFELLDSRLRKIALTIGWMIIAAGVIAALAFAWPFIAMLVRTLTPFLAALVFAYIFNPIVTFVQKRARLSRVGGVLFLYFLFVVAISIFFAILLPILITQIKGAYYGISDFISARMEQKSVLTNMVADVQAWLDKQGIVVEDLLKQAVMSEGVRKTAQNAATSGFRLVGDALTFVFLVIINLFGVVMAFVLVILANIYLLLDFSKLPNILEIIIPEKSRDRTFSILSKIDVAVGGFIRGMMIDAFLVGLMTFFGLYLIGLKEYALLIGILAGLGTLVPYMGPICGCVPALLYVIFSNTYDTTQERVYMGIWVIVLTVAIQLIEGFVFQPKIVGKAAQLHPLVVLFSLALGANFGILGLILAVPLACIGRVLVKEFYWDKRELSWRVRTGKNNLAEWEEKKLKAPEEPPAPPPQPA